MDGTDGTDTAELIELVVPKALQGKGRQARRTVGQLGTPMAVKSGSVFVRQGDVGRDCALIVSGTVEVLIDDEVVTRLDAGDVIGEIALLAARVGYGTRTASLRAHGDVVAIVFNRREFTTLCDVVPEFAAAVARIAVRRLDEDLTAARDAGADKPHARIFS
jgi:CRP-like cAMP-binding protein